MHTNAEVASPEEQSPISEHQSGSFEYELLKGHRRTDGSFKTDEQLRAEYVQLTDELIHQMTDGVIVKDRFTNEQQVERPDYVIWLDKSARPVSWLTKDLWPAFATRSDGTITKRPEFRFVNIDREQWVNSVDPNGNGRVDINLIDQSIIRSLRSIFVSSTLKKTTQLNTEIDSLRSELDDKTILIVDEVRATGKTLDIATKFFERAFPLTRVASTHWMAGVAMRDGAVGNADLPVWYQESSKLGRGVGNREERISQQSHSRTQRLGSWFLSTGIQGSDPSSIQLRTELKQLAEDAKLGNMLVLPSFDRDDLEERIRRYNHGMDFDTFVREKQELSAATSELNN